MTSRWHRALMWLLVTVALMMVAVTAWGQAPAGRRGEVIVESDTSLPRSPARRVDLDRPPPATDCNRNAVDDGLERWGMLARGPVALREGPYSIAAADFDGDRRTDLAVANQASGQVSILWHRFGRRFEVGPVIDVGSMPTCVQTGDLDGDGDADVAVGHAGVANAVTLLWNDGRGGFRREDLAMPAEPMASEPRCIALADLDGDGRLDIVASTGVPLGSPRNERLVLFGNAGGGRFASPASRFLTAAETPQGLAVADLDGDGRVDIVVSDGAARRLFIVSGSATAFAEWPVHEFGDVSGGWKDIRAADLDADGDIDLVLTDNGSDTVTVLLNDASRATWRDRFPTRTPLAVGPHPRAAAVVDVDGDGRPDIVVPIPDDAARGAADDRLAVLTQLRTGGFADARFISVGRSPTGVWAGQLDNDRGPEIAVAHSGTRELWVLHLGAVAVARDCNRNDVLDVCDIASGRSLDVDRDGVPDECRRPHPGPARRDRASR